VTTTVLVDTNVFTARLRERSPLATKSCLPESEQEERTYRGVGALDDAGL